MTEATARSGGLCGGDRRTGRGGPCSGRSSTAGSAPGSERSREAQGPNEKGTPLCYSCRPCSAQAWHRAVPNIFPSSEPWTTEPRPRRGRPPGAASATTKAKHEERWRENTSNFENNQFSRKIDTNRKYFVGGRCRIIRHA